ncbi:hypothetical protein PR048_005470 [Dryococelus australis]|uniref:HTH CENPB-type domain-containing protein n=1 Tax=Dryococelus australis TaxID=614101 RepID=A0ABQ9I8C0_9NEOP|nr:hypothetical protein PR048_005470 [Dryococelus australis]
MDDSEGCDTTADEYVCVCVSEVLHCVGALGCAVTFLVAPNHAAFVDGTLDVRCPSCVKFTCRATALSLYSALSPFSLRRTTLPLLMAPLTCVVLRVKFTCRATALSLYSALSPFSLRRTTLPLLMAPLTCVVLLVLETRQSLAVLHSCAKGIIDYELLTKPSDIPISRDLSRKNKYFSDTCGLPHNRHDLQRKFTYEWICRDRSNNIPLSGPLKREKALDIAKESGFVDFEASVGWLDEFCSRHNMSYKNICGEGIKINENVVTEWKEKMNELCVKGILTKTVSTVIRLGFSSVL